MLSKEFFKKTSVVFVMILSAITFIAVLTTYLAFSYYMDKEMRRYKMGHYSEQVYKLSYFISSQLEESVNIDEDKEFYDGLAKEFSLHYELYTDDMISVYESPGLQTEQEHMTEMDTPIILEGDKVGYLRAYYDLDNQVVSVALLNHQKRIETQLRTLAIVILFSLLIVSFIVTFMVNRSIQSTLKHMLPVLRGKRDVTIPRSGTLEMQYMVDSVNSVLIEFRNMENWRKQMMQDLTHELRTPLTSVLVMAEAVIDGVYPASKEVLEDIYKEVERLSRLIFNVQNLSEAEGARFRLNTKKVNLISLIKNTYDGFLFVAKEKNIRLLFIHPHRPCIAEVDPDRFTQVITNLIANALKYTPEYGRVEVGVDIFEDEICFYCLDNGVGMSKTDQTLIFNRFYRVDKSRSNENDGAGSGIGLNISSALAEAHGWKMGVESELDEGSKFWVKIPVANDTN